MACVGCESCHGAEQEGLVGPSLVNSLKALSKEDFHTTIINGRPEKGMPPWKGVLSEGSAPLVARAAAYARTIGRTPVEPDRARTLLGIKPRNGV